MTIVGSHKFHTAATSTGLGEIWSCGYLLTKAIVVETTNFTGKIQLQGSFDNDNYTNLAYELLGQEGTQIPTNADVSFTVHTGFSHFVTKELWEFIRVEILERSQGSISLRGFGSEN